MSKVFNAKRQEVEATYEFLDGTTASMIIVSLSTKEGKELAVLSKDESKTGNDFIDLAIGYHLQRTDKSIVKKIMKEQNDEGNIIEFFQGLSALIEEEKKGKSNG